MKKLITGVLALAFISIAGFAQAADTMGGSSVQNPAHYLTRAGTLHTHGNSTGSAS